MKNNGIAAQYYVEDDHEAIIPKELYMRVQEEMVRRIHWNNHGCKSIVWRCAGRLEQGGGVCNARTVNEKELEQVVLKALNEMLSAKSTYKEQLQKNLI